jgi:hypothetical protein
MLLTMKKPTKKEAPVVSSSVRQAVDDPQRIIRLMAEVLAGTQVPRSLNALGAAARPWDELRKMLGLFGYADADQIEFHLRAKLLLDQLP